MFPGHWNFINNVIFKWLNLISKGRKYIFSNILEFLLVIDIFCYILSEKNFGIHLWFFRGIPFAERKRPWKYLKKKTHFARNFELIWMSYVSSLGSQKKVALITGQLWTFIKNKSWSYVSFKIFHEESSINYPKVKQNEIH